LALFAPQIQWGFPIDIVHNTNLLTYLLTCLNASEYKRYIDVQSCLYVFVTGV